MTGALTAGEFCDFFEAIHGVPPFPWQERLLRDWVGGPKGWPEILDLPTGSGKTAVLDIAVFHLATEADKGVERTAPVRIAFVVDRRLIVDDAFNRAKKLQDALADAAGNSDAPGIVRRVARCLGRLAEHPGRPLLARRLRGGVPREDDWARTPCQPTILCSTVDQVGSRLLFRGYGVRDRMKPVHAGLLGSDCLILLDEVHLSRPLRQTLTAVKKYRCRCECPPQAPFEVALLSATPGETNNRPEREQREPFQLTQEDREHPVLRRRLDAAKPAKLCDIKGKQGQIVEDQRVEAVAEQVAAALPYLQERQIDAPAIGIIVNRVLRARRIFECLKQTYGATDDMPARADVELVIGPAREIDRQARADKLGPIKTGADRQLPRPLIVVATQTIEAGVDLDFDALITEMAPLDALKQRFGRLNRAGRLNRNGCPIKPFAAVLAHREDARPGKEGDPVYGQAAGNTWTALQKLAEERGDPAIVDFGISRGDDTPWVGEISPEQMQREGLLASKPDAPVLMPAYVDLWAQTWPLPAADPEISLFLHGSDRSPTTVQIVWRGDIDRAALRGEWPGVDLKQLLAAVPPRPAEAIEISLRAARRWLGAVQADHAPEHPEDFADVAERNRDEVRAVGAPAFRWAGPDSELSEAIYPNQIRPNDLIVVPADYGGCDKFGWKPEARERVRDVADAAALPFAGRRFAVRIAAALVHADLPSPDDQNAVAARDGAAAFANKIPEIVAEWRDAPRRRRASDLVDALLDAAPPEGIKKRLERLKSTRRGLLQPIFPYGDDQEERPHGIVLVAPKGIVTPQTEMVALDEGGVPATEDDDLGSTSGEPLTLAQHSCDVGADARGFAHRIGLPPAMVGDIALSGYLHDAGKADERFQAMLYGGDWFAVNENAVLAKSLPGVGQAARDRAGLPDNWRHEALSVRLARKHSRFQQEAHDKELVLWLIGVHHGYGRPLFPHADPCDAHDRELPAIEGGRTMLKAGAGPQSLAFEFKGWDWPQLFDRLKHRYGAWELARMEAIVRLADHRASETRDETGRAT